MSFSTARAVARPKLDVSRCRSARPRPRLRAPPALERSTAERQFSATTRQYAAAQGSESYGARLGKAWRNTRIQWKPIPIGLGIGFLGFTQLYKVQQREKQRIEEEQARSTTGGGEPEGPGRKPKKRKRVRPSGPLTVRLMSYLPLKRMSRVWGWFNELTIPYYLRVPGFKLYSWIFGVNLSEVSEPDLHVYPNLAAFFYRTLKPGVRPLASNPTALLAPADGKVLSFGVIEHGEVEQIKGMTYSLEALLGTASPTLEGEPEDVSADEDEIDDTEEGLSAIKADEEFANVNGISYTLPSSFSPGGPRRPGPGHTESIMDASTAATSSSIAEVRADLALANANKSWFFPAPKVPTALYYVVIYLAPGDYHRFHSPVSWVAETRRHFAGELYSVSPYLQRTLPGLFTLNERVVLLGRWRWGFFSFTPVGATNVGSIRVHFDRELRTNSLLTDTAADRAAAAAGDRGEPYCGYAEATYGGASSVLGGHALRKGEEMGGFQLGSSIVLVFEAPKGRRLSFDEAGLRGDARKGGWTWCVQKGQRVRYGEAMGWVDEE